jgi:hypothetical protein
MRGQTAELLEPMTRTARMIKGHFEGILAHWTRGLMILKLCTQKPVLDHKAKDSGLLDGGTNDRHALHRRW